MAPASNWFGAFDAIDEYNQLKILEVYCHAIN